MATVGQALTAPESGWKRYDDTNSNISYIGTWSPGARESLFWNGAKYNGTGNSIARFNFTGAKLRIIGYHAVDRSKSISIFVDGIHKADINQNVSSVANQIFQCLEISLTDLTDKEHYVAIVNNDSSGTTCLSIDAIDIDESGELKPYFPTNANNLLRVTMLDSSEREYKVTFTEVDGFVNWYNHHAATDAASYAINDIVDGSKEYLAFEKIISFKVIPLAQ